MAYVRLLESECDRRGELPEHCMVCGSRADDYVMRQFIWHPSWTYWLLLLGVLPVFIAQLVTRQTMRVYAPACRAHRKHWTVKTAATFIGGIGILILFFAIPIVIIESTRGQRPPTPDMVGYAVLGGAFVCLLLIALLVWFVRRGVTVSEIDQDEIHFRGVADEFAEAVKQMREERKARRNRTRSDADDSQRTPVRARRVSVTNASGEGESPIILD